MDSEAAKGDEDWDGNAWGDGGPESPHKPGNIDQVDILHFNSNTCGSLGSQLSGVTVSEISTPPGIKWVWVVVRIDS